MVMIMIIIWMMGMAQWFFTHINSALAQTPSDDDNEKPGKGYLLSTDLPRFAYIFIL